MCVRCFADNIPMQWRGKYKASHCGYANYGTQNLASEELTKYGVYLFEMSQGQICCYL